MKYKFTGELVEGTIVGYNRKSKGLYGIEGYSYRIRLEYNEELYYVTALEGTTVTNGTIPKKNLGLQCLVYFNPKSHSATIKGFYQIEWLAFYLFITGILAIIVFLKVEGFF